MQTVRSVLLRRRLRSTALGLLAGFAAAGLDLPAQAQDQGSSTNAMVNLTRLLVKRGVISKEDADILIKEALQEASSARTAAKKKPAAALAAAPEQATPAPLPEAPAQAGVIRVPYVPQIVKDQIRDEVKQELVQEARTEHWIDPGILPDWMNRITINGDFRLRYERDFYGQNNTNQLIDYQGVNSGSPFDLSTNSQAFPPLVNTLEDRSRFRLRGRLGFTADVADDGNVIVGFRLGSGSYTGTGVNNQNTPVSLNQTLGASFTKDPVWIDRAFLTIKTPLDGLSLTGGRIANPFFSTPVVWYDDLNLDGVAALYNASVADGLAVFATIGGFPIQNTPDSSAGQPVDGIPVKANSRDSWLAAAQLGAEWKVDPENRVKLGVAYYDYIDYRGKESAACTTGPSSSPGDAQLLGCNTDNTRPGFMQKGNTVFPLRNLVAEGAVTNPPLPEYFGLASQFRELEITGLYDYMAFDPIHLIIDGDFVENIGFNRKSILELGAFNNTDGAGHLQSGNLAWSARVTFGHPVTMERWDWNLSIAYRYIEPDAVVDAYNDADFHYGGTNAKGFIFGGNLGIAHNTWINARYFSADEIFGPPLSIDVLEVDLNTRF